ncbi:MAG TPA: hypothetical protein VLF15_05685, partial [Pseudoxanthomonas sp.]|nr:hypothetical protein [Pseudoxanthomonas sp.]
MDHLPRLIVLCLLLACSVARAVPQDYEYYYVANQSGLGNFPTAMAACAAETSRRNALPGATGVYTLLSTAEVHSTQWRSVGEF